MTATSHWVREAAELWAAGIGAPSFPRIGAALKPLVDTFGWPDVKPSWSAYCRLAPYYDHGRFDRNVDRRRFCSPQDFVNTLNTWQDLAEPYQP